MRAMRTLCLLVALALAGCATAPPAPALWRVSDVAASYSPTVALRDNKNNGVVGTADPAIARKLIEVRNRIEAASGVRATEFFLASGSQPNAFSSDTAKGTVVAVNIAMLDMIGDDVDGYASVLGHEYAHLALHHSSVRQDREQTRMAASNVIGIVLAAVGIPFGGTIASVGTSAIERTYSRDEERDADKLGMDYMVKAGYDPQGAVRLWQKLTTNATGAAIPFLSTHPSGDERLKSLSEMANAAKANAPASQRP